jgi:hypothetical protein
MTSETSARETPAVRATSSIVGGFFEAEAARRALVTGVERARLTAMASGSILPRIGAR